MSKSIHIDDVNNIYVSQTSEGLIEMSLGVDGSPLSVNLKSLTALKELCQKMEILNATLFQTTYEKENNHGN